MYYMNHDAFDYFIADFTHKESILHNKHYPLGFFAVEALEFGTKNLADVQRHITQFQKDLEVFLSARDASSMAVAYRSIRRLWMELSKFPVYDKLLKGDHRVDAVLPHMKDHPEKVDEMLTPGTELNAAYRRWMEKLNCLTEEFAAFVRNTEWMLNEYFMPLPSRRVEHYAQALSDYKRDIHGAQEMEELTGEKDYTVDLDSIQFQYPVSISFVPRFDPESKRAVIAEQMTFDTLVSFLYMDLYKGMAAGNLPRRCQHCRRWFVSIGAYNTLYCNRPVPGLGGKTCRDIGAHEKEKENRKGVGKEEYYRIYNRLKARKQRGKISVDDWNRKVVCAQELRERYEKREISKEQYIEKLNAL